MFTNEQNISQNIRKPVKKEVFETGITLANTLSVKRRITYKELTLAFGILVAMVVAMTLWAKSPADKKSSQINIVPKIGTLAAAKSVVSMTLEVIF